MKELLHSSSELRFGAFEPEHVVALDPDISKLKRYIDFVADYTFDEGVLLVADRIQRKRRKLQSTGRDKCLVCGASLRNSQTVFACDDMPASAQDIPTKEELELLSDTIFYMEEGKIVA